MWELWIFNYTFLALCQMQNGLYIKCRSWWVEQFCYSWLFYSKPSRVPKTSAWLWILSKFEIECFKLDEMAHLMTSNETILNTKLLDLIKTYISYMDHIFIRINLIESEARVFKFEDGLWSNDGENDLEWKSFEYQVVRAHQYPNFLYRPFFHLEKFM